MAIRRIRMGVVGTGTYYTFPINPINFENPDQLPFNVTSTVDGKPIIMTSQYNSQVKTLEWVNLPNKSSPINYKELVSNLKYYVGKKCNLKLMDLSGDTTDTTIQTVLILSCDTKYTSGAESHDAHLKYEYVRLNYIIL